MPFKTSAALASSFIYIVSILLIVIAVALYLKKYKKKKKQLYLTLDRIKDAVISVDNEWRYTFLNDAALKTHPLGREKTLGKVLWDVHPGLRETAFWDTYHDAKMSGEIIEVESYFAEIGRWFSAKAYPSETGLTIFYHDITESKMIEIQLSKSEEKYRTLFYKSPLPVWLYDVESLRFIDVNDAAVRHYGYSREEFLSMTIKDIRPQEDIEGLLDVIEQVRNDTGSSRYSAWRHRKKNGDILNVEVTAHSLSHDGRDVRVVIVNDITQKTIMERELLENQRKLNEAQAIGRLANWDINLLTRAHTWSDELYKIFGLEKAETQPSVSLFFSLIHPEDKEAAKNAAIQAMTDCTEAKIDFRFVTHSGKKRYGYIECRFEYNANNEPVRLFGILQDITPWKEAEESSKRLESKIKEQKIQAQKRISKAIIKAQEQQKNYIAQELHDNINQILYGVRFHLGAAGRRNESVSEVIKDPVEQISKVMDEIHLMCQNLVTPLIYGYLEEIIKDLIQKLTGNLDSPINIKLSYSIPFEIIDDLKLNIYRIIQEQLHNILKHADAKNVNITLGVIGSNIFINVEDDGKGYDVKLKRKGLGISNIIHRVEAFNGSVSIQSEPGYGCKTSITIPYETCADSGR